MPTPLNRETIRRHLEGFDLRSLFIEELGWDHGGENIEVTVASKPFVLEVLAHKRGLVVYQHIADTDDTFPDHPTRQKIEKAVAKTVREHLVVYVPPDRSVQYWQWVKREPGQPDRPRSEAYHPGEAGERLIQKLEQLVFTLDEEDDLTIVDVSGRVRAAFDVEKVTRKFYDRFKQEHRTFLDFIEGIQHSADREWYASLMLNRMMFIYFIQKRGFLDSDPDYLRNRLHNALADALVDDLESNAEVRVRRRADGSERREVNYFVGKSKKLIDEIDRTLARHYGFTDEELDFIINYDIKYRMGRDG